MPPLETIAAIVVGILLPARAAFVGARVAEAIGRLDGSGRVGLYRANAATLWLLALLVMGATFLSGETAAWLGMVPPTDGSVGTLLVLLGLALLSTIADVSWSLADRRRRARFADGMRGALAIAPRTANEFRSFVVLAFSAAVAEEIVFRGFLVTYVSDLAGGDGLATVVGVVAPAVAFGLVHLYQGAAGAIRVALLGGFYGLLFVVSGSILPSIVAHLVHDLVGGWMAMRLVREPSPSM